MSSTAEPKETCTISSQIDLEKLIVELGPLLQMLFDTNKVIKIRNFALQLNFNNHKISQFIIDVTKEILAEKLNKCQRTSKHSTL